MKTTMKKKMKKDKAVQKLGGTVDPLSTNVSITSSKRRSTFKRSQSKEAEDTGNSSFRSVEGPKTGRRFDTRDEQLIMDGYLHKKERKPKGSGGRTGGATGGGASTGAGVPGGGISHPPIQDYNDLAFIGKIAAHLTPKISVDRRSIGGERQFQEKAALDAAAVKTGPTTSGSRTSITKGTVNVLLQSQEQEKETLRRMVNEDLLTLRVNRFDIFHRGQARPLYTGMGSSNTSPHSKSTNHHLNKNKGRGSTQAQAGSVIRPRYVSLVRTTNRPLIVNKGSQLDQRAKNLRRKQRMQQRTSKTIVNRRDSMEDDEEGLSEPEDEDYDVMYEGQDKKKASKKTGLTDDDDAGGTQDETDEESADSQGDNSESESETDEEGPDENELSSFPVLVLLAASEYVGHHNMAPQLEIRKVYPLEELITVECLPSANAKGGVGSMGNASGGAPIGGGALNNNTLEHGDVGSILLTFKNGDSVEIDCTLPPEALIKKPTAAQDVDDPEALGVDEIEPQPTGSSSVSTDKNIPAPATPGSGDGTKSPGSTNAAGGMGDGLGDSASSHDYFLWSLFQIHTMLCTCVVERSVMQFRAGQRLLSFAKKVALKMGNASSTPASNIAKGDKPPANLPPLTLRNVDRSELQYLSTVNGFVGKSQKIHTLLRRQRHVHARKEFSTTDKPSAISSVPSVDRSVEGEEELEAEEGKMKRGSNLLRLDDLALDLLMMAGGSSFVVSNQDHGSIFTSNDEEADACQVLNKAIAQHNHSLSRTSNLNVMEVTDKQAMDAVVTGEKLNEMLQKRMRDLEADACRRLIAWEDEKLTSSQALDLIDTHRRNERDMVDCMSLVGLFATLDELDAELEKMEAWLSERVAFIRPLTNECRAMEEENRGLEQHNKSCEALKQELALLLQGLEVRPELEAVLRQPRRSLVTSRTTGAIDLENSSKGIDLIKEAGKELRCAIDKAMEGGGLHLDAVYERVEELIALATKFCSELQNIVVEVMKALANDVVPPFHTGALPKTESHASMARKIRDIQRKFQSSLLSYIKLIEVLALLKPETLPSTREVYANLVADGILSKKRMKAYFHLLPGHAYATTDNSNLDLKDYPICSMKHKDVSGELAPLNAEDIGLALTEMLPVIAREAYFTAALFGLSGKNLDGREKKRNFEAVKKSVDDSSVWFRYYLSRACGIADQEGGKTSDDTMLSLVASIHLNESMEAYIDRQKKGGDHSLSLAYVRATILDFRKKVDKKWVDWVEEQIKWIRSSPGVPLNGKRAGVIMAFSKFPSYLDHILLSCRAGRGSDYKLTLSKIKVVSYYLQKMAGALFASLQECAMRETTDQQYGANVMRMENSYYFLESIKKRGPELTELFHKQLTAAGAIYKQSTDAYLGWMIKREFKSLHSLFSNISRIRREVGDADVPIHVPRQTFIKTLTKESSREVMKEKIATMYLRMEKHLSADAALLPHAWKSLVRVLYEWFGRWEKLSSHCYNFKLEPGAVEVVRIAKIAGGGSKKVSGSQTPGGPPSMTPGRSVTGSINDGSTTSSPTRRSREISV